VVKFSQVTGFQRSDWERYWPRWGDAVREAGLEPNSLNPGYGDEFLLEQLAALSRMLGKVPTSREINVARREDPSIPHGTTFQRQLGTKAKVVTLLREHALARGYGDVVEMCLAADVPEADQLSSASPSAHWGYGFVYLARGHRHEYKIGRTTLVDRRIAQIAVAAPIEYDLVHEIKTDDPVGVERYWHERFAEKRMRGEWFRLSVADVRAFKRWKRIF
jgi:hypothetical protein